MHTKETIKHTRIGITQITKPDNRNRAVEIALMAIFLSHPWIKNQTTKIQEQNQNNITKTRYSNLRTTNPRILNCKNN